MRIVEFEQGGSKRAAYALEGLPNKVLAREYRLALPEPKLHADEIDKTRERLESRRK